ncbi:MAG: hypothetical protein KDA63_07280 [Planctomycetales bacterium]|nr:hypothetical protein [Planctomycetales bacterium]
MHRFQLRLPTPFGWRFVTTLVLGVVVLGAWHPAHGVDAERRLRVGTFDVDATPPLGSQLAYNLAERVDDPLSARGIVLVGSGEPIVLCAVDWIGIGNGGHDEWRERLAKAAGTSPQRVAVHVLHQHDAPDCDFSAEQLLAAHGLAGTMFNVAFARQTIDRVATAVAEAVQTARPVTHLGVGTAKVEKVASNRRILGPDGKVAIVRYSSSRDPAAIAAPEGVIDPVLKLVNFWDGETPIASVTYYATHPQSYYRTGGISADFVGLARGIRDKELPGPLHVHFNGASGNVAAGKYNDGSPAMRPILAERLAEGMRRAWEAVERTPLSVDDVAWEVVPTALPPRDTLVASELEATLADEAGDDGERDRAARDLAFLRRCQSGHRFDVTCLTLGDVKILHLPGELFVEYQLAAQRMRPEATVCMAAYGDYGPGYIGTEIAYSQGGYETSYVSRTAPEVEAALTEAIAKLLD